MAAMALAGCSEQPWVFENGIGMPEGPPDAILAQAYVGGECGFACQPPGGLAYCAKLRGDEQGPPPDLERGQRYCFVGVATDASGTPTGIGCTVATAGTDAPIEVVFSPVDGINRATECAVDPDPPRFDAGPPPMDAGTPDSGPPPVDATVPDAGPPPQDAGPPPTPDAGPQEVSLSTTIDSGGRVLIRNETGRGWDVPGGVTFEIGTLSGRQYTVTANPTAPSVFVRFEGGGCGTENPCTVTVTENTALRVVFGPGS
ncbi:MAG: hypothetical protein AB8I08_37010 [Sandaracinaceae bacterium]